MQRINQSGLKEENHFKRHRSEFDVKSTCFSYFTPCKLLSLRGH